ncbi:hypothetical protein Nepgr_030603 [Nepenthes gracilis]|uniref:SANT domain-containing protein n=1 Tax=Nepenthes gracilis TaxID=150966 RepID=A0AAD3TEW7_NEPGR|nr:hypothetical protein Nepgr_030603 [Nepenthes gracilis]
MQTVAQVSLECEEQHHPKNNLTNDGCSLAIPSSSNYVASQLPAKKQTRQWAAWTREEEESFFSALRHVGKNFEKITCRVQSKNKDQVRHYYYRLVRRMNKLLGPGFCLDAKNSKDTNAAMLRWWSLLEKYSCKASKLHLKPRRFKIFIEALEHQLLKDRKKNVKKRYAHAENCSVPSQTSFLNQNNPSGNDTRAVKFVLVDNQNIQKAGPGRGSSMRRNTNMGLNHSSNCSIKGDMSPMKDARQRRKSSAAVSAATMKRWQKAAIAGVSLVADAAEHLERTAGDREVGFQTALNKPSVQTAVSDNEQSGLSHSVPPQPHFPNASGSYPSHSNLQNSAKLKLQLFPIDEATRRSLEMENHNPHLELTLSTRKKISSVLEHLNRKWGNSSVACGELMLFPYTVQRENLMQYQRWTRDSIVSAADVFAITGNPPVFRLRYGWILRASNVLEECNRHDNTRNQEVRDLTRVPAPGSNRLGDVVSHYKDQHTLDSHNAVFAKSPTKESDDRTGSASKVPGHSFLKSPSFAATRSWQRSHANIGTAVRETENIADQSVMNSAALSPAEWADSLTNISVGDLLAEASHNIDDSTEPLAGRSPHCIEDIPFTCDSFDAAIAAHISFQQNKMASHSSSIWDAEETRDSFSISKISLPDKLVFSSSLPAASVTCVNEDFPEGKAMPDDGARGDPMDECPLEDNELENFGKDFNSLTDIYWPESLGPLDLDVPSCRYYGSEDLILSDSLSGLNRLIASSLDAFQSCSFFGLEKKEPSSAVEAQGSAASCGGSSGGDCIRCLSCD